MKALVKYKTGKGFVEIREVPRPEPGPGEVLIRVVACGICGTDLHILQDEFPNTPPVIMGHELSGTIEVAGAGVEHWRPGDRVVTELHVNVCGRCWLCRTGNRHKCPDKRPPGSQVDGGFAEFVKVPEGLVHSVPEDLDIYDAALCEPVAICVHALTEWGKVDPGDFAVVLGPGPIGLISAVLAKRIGASHVVITGVDRDREKRFDAARRLGIDTIVNVEHEDLAEVVLRLTKGKGADVVVEASGSERAIHQATQIIASRATIIVLGLTHEPEISFPWNQVVSKETTLAMCFSSTWTSWEKALQFLSEGTFDTSVLCERRPLEQWQGAFEDLAAGRAIKVLLTPT